MKNNSEMESNATINTVNIIMTLYGCSNDFP